jgi:energy-coupling factor transporter ATP-binding protein EcfA2
MELLCDVANEALMVIASSGTGKSTIMKWLGNVVKRERLIVDALTVNGLRKLDKVLSFGEKTILIDDLSKGGTVYSQVMTVCAMSELCYTGYIYKYTANLELAIEGFKGCAIMNAQPLILKRILSAPEFETDIRDKCIRYYHIPRPINPILAPPEVEVDYDYDTSNIRLGPDVNGSSLWKKTMGLFRFEFSSARAKEHLSKLSRAGAKLCGRTQVSDADVYLVKELCRGFILENEIFEKEDLEGERMLNVNILPLLSMISTWGIITIDDLCFEFQVKVRRAYEIVRLLRDYVEVKDGKIFLTDYGRALLKDIGEW